MSNQTNKNQPDNRSEDRIIARLRSVWYPGRESNPRLPRPKRGALSAELPGHTRLL